MVEQRSAASMNYAEVCSEGAASDSAARANISWEAQRRTAGPKAIAQYAAGNPAINTAMTKHNIDRVNDGAGGWRETRSIAEVVKYGDDRVARMSAAPKDGNRVALTTVGQLPWAYCEPDGTEYQAVDKNGKPKVYAEGPRAGEPVRLPRYKIREDRREEAMRYFDDWLAYQASVLPGGQASMHGYSINLDESRPHIQLLSDPFEAAPSAKNPDALKSGYSRVFGRHPKDPMVPKLDKAGQPVVGDDGEAVMVKDNARTKMTRYQAGLRAFMVERGYEVDPERDEERHDRHLGLADYKDLQHSKTEVQYALADVGAVLGEVEALREEAAESSISAASVEGDLVAAHESATESGFVEGLTAGEATVAARTAELDQRAAGLAEREGEIDARAAEVEATTRRQVLDAMEAEARKAKADADQIRADAETEAGRIVDGAQTEAEEIKSRARTEAKDAADAELAGYKADRKKEIDDGLATYEAEQRAAIEVDPAEVVMEHRDRMRAVVVDEIDRMRVQDVEVVDGTMRKAIDANGKPVLTDPFSRAKKIVAHRESRVDMTNPHTATAMTESFGERRAAAASSGRKHGAAYSEAAEKTAAHEAGKKKANYFGGDD